MTETWQVIFVHNFSYKNVHLNFVPLTLDAATRLGETNTFVFSAIWLAHEDEREFVISSAWKQSRSPDKANSCELNGLVKSLRCRLRKGRGCAPNTTEKPRRALQIHRAAVRVRNLLFLERDPNWNGHVCFLRKRFVTADLNGLQAPVLLFCFNRERQTAKEM